MRIERHPKMNVWVREDGCIFLPQSGTHKAKWTFGSLDAQGYRVVGIGGKIIKVHRLVAETYLQNPDNLPEVDHIDRNKSNNNVANLRFVSRSGNQRNTPRNDTCLTRFGVHTYEDRREYHRIQEKSRRAACRESYNQKARERYRSKKKESV